MGKMGKQKCKKNPRDSICLCCLEKIKDKYPKQIEKTSLDSKIIAHVYPEFCQEKEFLPKVICKTCKDNLENESKCGMFPLVNYDQLVENVKLNHTNLDCTCELCRISSATVCNSEKTVFLIKGKNKIGKLPSPSKLPDITDLLPLDKNQTKNGKLEEFCASVSKDSLDQVCAKHLQNQVLYYTKPIFIILIINY